MMPWFIWKGKNSLSDYGLWINKLPKRVRAEERHEEIEIPGRAGTVLMLEGEDVYSTYSAEMVVIARNDLNIHGIIDWLRGSSELVLSTELDKARQARIVGEVAFERVGNNLQQATIPFVFQPFRVSRKEETDRFSISSSTADIFNPGDVSSKPTVKVVKTGSATISVGNTSMSFTHLPGEVVIDCDAELIITKARTYSASDYYYVGDYANYSGDSTYSAGLYRFTSEGVGESASWERIDNQIANYEYVWLGAWTGEMLRIPKGKQTFTLTGSPALTVDPKWRWL